MSVIAPVSRVTAAFVAELNANFAWLNRHVGLYVTPEAFGAAGDGVTDDSVAFQDAINAGGGGIALGGGKTYRVRNVTVPSGSACPGIFGMCGQARIVPPVGSTSAHTIFFVEKEDGFVFENIFFEMPASTTTTLAFNRAIRFQPLTNFTGTGYRVEGCKFSGANGHISGVGFTLKNSRFANNYSTNSYGDSFSFNALLNVEIVDNIFTDTSIGTIGATPAGAVRTGAPEQREATLNLTISRNHFIRCSLPTGQSSIDCYSGSASNIRIEENIIEDCGGTIELKTSAWVPTAPSVPTLPETYSNIVIANNTIRPSGLHKAGGISVIHATANPAGKCHDIEIYGNKLLCEPAFVAGSGFESYAIIVLGYDNVSIHNNRIGGYDKGIAVGGTDGGGGTNTASNITISSNVIDNIGGSIQQAGGTIVGLYINNNPLLRGSEIAAGSVGSLNGTFINGLEMSNNRIEVLAIGRYAVTLQGVTDGLITNNTIVADANPIYFSGGTMTNLRIADNNLRSITSHALRLDVGTQLNVRNNQINVPAGFRAVSGTQVGLGGNVAAENVRGVIAADPTGTYAGSVGDVFLDSTAATAGWRCITAGAAGAAVYTEIGAEVAPSRGTYQNYLFNAGVVTPPAAGSVRFNNASQNSVTTIWMNYTTNDSNSVNLKTYWAQRVAAGDHFYFQDKDDPTKWKLFELTSAYTDSGTYATMAVTWKAGGNDLTAARIIVTREPT